MKNIHVLTLAAPNQARAGFFGDDGEAAELCPAGSYCPPRSVRQQRCPDNTISGPGSAELSDCKAAPGYFGIAGELAEPCPNNYFCPGGSSERKQCPPNTVSPGVFGLCKFILYHTASLIFTDSVEV